MGWRFLRECGLVWIFPTRWPYGEGALRSKVIDLVGHNSRHANPIMHTSGTYDLVYQTLWALLPPCDHDEKACGWGE
jgi:hypothetical protein